MNAGPTAVAPTSGPVASSVGQALAAAEGEIARIDARILLACAMNCDAAYLIAHADDALDARCRRAFEALVARRAAGEPVAYLVSRREFFGLEFRVSPAVLVPRPETELLVEFALDRIPPDGPCSVLDLGTGSGCVAIAIAHHRPRARVTATDSAPGALALARVNAAAAGVTNIEFVAGDWWNAVHGRRFDVIVSNPPYIAEADRHLEQGDLRFEPRSALVGGADGLDALRQLAAQAGRHLCAGGWIALEHGHDQGRPCRELLQGACLSEVFTSRDLAGIERISGGRFDADQTND